MVQYNSKEWSVRSLADRFEKGVLKLEPVFQRRSVWRKKQRMHLLDSIFQGYPLPSIFLYRHVDQTTGKTVFEVVDGKQRLESLFMYMGLVRGGRFAARFQLPGVDRPQLVDWRRLCQAKLQSRVEEYSLQVVEVNADDFVDIIELFVRINSTGNALTSQEIRNARFYESEFLKTAKRLASRYEAYLEEIGVVGSQQVRRMKHIELMGELLFSAHIGGVGNKKRVLDTAMRHDGLTGVPLRKAAQLTVAGLNRLRRMFPDISRSVRFHKLSDFYSLAVVVQALEQRGCVLDDRKRNSLGWSLLVSLSAGVDELSERSKKLDIRALSPREELYRQYVQAAREGSDSEANRRKRHDVLLGLLEPIFRKKDGQRLFSPEQRRILWNTSDERVCAECGCPLTWSDFQADHIRPWTRGGRTTLDNAALLCATHNASKGKRGRRAA